ncbi:MAG TPA: exodeoxyribonuclease I [Magnetospirillaceae bacterium]|nr:exodeoxyribonuclease I [Magnetospirillaceae bacterium]
MNSFFFYDLETSGFDPRRQRIMQFAGQRTDMDLKPIGDPINVYVTLAEDVLPDPGAVLITGITPQKTHEEGYNEADFLKLIQEQVFTPGTIITGFNSVRFDDEFMRYTLYRNFYDPYEWQWKDGRSRWDMLDVIRMTRALRPEGIEWPVDHAGQPTNRLELLTRENGLDHANAHDALSDVTALIAIAKLIKDKQPKLFEFLLKSRGKQEVARIVNLDDPQPFVYSSGRYPKGTLHTTVAIPVAPAVHPGTVIVYDLRHDPTEWATKSVDELKKIRFAPYELRQTEGFVALPAKELAYNKCPAVAPLGVLDQAAQDRIVLDIKIVQENLAKFRHTDLADKLREVFAADREFPKNKDVDAQLYDSFIGDRDKPKMAAIRAANAHELADFVPDFADERLPDLLLRYKGRNYQQSLSESEHETWESYRAARLQADLPKFTLELHRYATTNTSEHDQFLLQELQLWAESVAPAPD